MLNIIRRNSQSIWVKAILLVIGASFIVGFGLLTGGVEQLNFNSGSVVATVGNAEITNLDISREYTRIYDRLREEMGDQLDQNVLEQLNLRRQALSQLITQEMLSQNAEALGLRAGDAEVFESIKGVPAFQTGGVFDPKRYKAVLAQQRGRLTPTIFEKSQKNSILIAKIRDYIAGSIVVPPEQALQKFIRENTTIQADYLVFTPEQFAKDVKIAPEQIQSYYDTNPDQFQSGKKLSLAYIRVSPGILQKDIKITDEELETYYRDNQQSLAREYERADAAHILIRVEKTASSTVKADALKRAEDALARATSGEDFANLAKSLSEDPGTAQQGGSLGQFKRNQMVEAFDNAVFDAKDGEIVGPVETSFGYHVIKVNTVTRAEDISLDTLKEAVRAELLQKRGQEKMAQIRQQIEQGIAAGDTLDKLAEQTNTNYKTDTFAENDPAALSKYPPELSEQFLASDFPDNGKWMEFAGVGYWLVVKARQESSLIPLIEVRDQISNQLKRENSVTVSAEKASDAVKKLQTGTKLNDLATSLRMEIKSTGPVNLEAKSVEGIAESEELAGAVKRLSITNPVVRNAVRIGTSFYVPVLAERKDVTLEEFEAVKDTYINSIREELYQAAWTSWLKLGRQEASIDERNSSIN